MKAFIENGNIFVQDILIPKDAITIDVPEGTSVEDLVIDNGVLRLKTEEEKQADKKLKEAQEALMLLAETDTKMIRVIENVIDILISKNVINEKDLPDDVKEKLSLRKSLRKKVRL